MGLIPLRRPPSEPEPPLSPARQALQSNITEFKREEARLNDLARFARARDAAVQRRDQAQQVLSDIDKREREVLRAWAANPGNERPVSLVAERSAAMTELAVAEHDLEIAQREADSVKQLVDEELPARIRDLWLARSVLIREVLLDEVRALVPKRMEVLREQARVEGALQGLFDSLMVASDSQGRLAAASIARMPLALSTEEQAQVAVEGERTRRLWLTLYPRLASGDISATVELDPEPGVAA